MAAALSLVTIMANLLPALAQNLLGKCSSLDLKSKGITSVSPGVFTGMDALSVLYLDGNSLFSRENSASVITVSRTFATQMKLLKARM